MGKKLLQPTELQNIRLNMVPIVLQKLSLYNLSYLYNHYQNALLLTSETIGKEYVSCNSKDDNIHSIQVNQKCMYNLNKFEQILFYIKQECTIRNIDGRFNININL